MIYALAIVLAGLMAMVREQDAFVIIGPAIDLAWSALKARRWRAAGPALANAVTLATHLGDLTTGAPPDVDIVLAADLFYAADLAERVTRFLDRCLAANIAGNGVEAAQCFHDTLADNGGRDFGFARAFELADDA